MMSGATTRPAWRPRSSSRRTGSGRGAIRSRPWPPTSGRSASAGPSGEPGLLSRCLEGRASVSLERGGLEDALALIQEAERLARIAGDPAILARALFSRAKVRRARGEPADALPDLEEAGRLLRSIGNRAEMAGVLDEKRRVLTDLGDLAAARQAEHRASLLRAELGTSDAPESAVSPAGRLDSRLAALRLDEQEYRRAGRKVLLAQTLVEQAYHWAILRRVPARRQAAGRRGETAGGALQARRPPGRVSARD